MSETREVARQQAQAGPALYGRNLDTRNLDTHYSLPSSTGRTWTPTSWTPTSWPSRGLKPVREHRVRRNVNLRCGAAVRVIHGAGVFGDHR